MGIDQVPAQRERHPDSLVQHPGIHAQSSQAGAPSWDGKAHWSGRSRATFSNAAASAIQTNRFGRCHESSMTTASGPPGKGTPAESRRQMKKRPGTPQVRRMFFKLSITDSSRRLLCGNKFAVSDV